MNILVVAAHPDDEILGCGGTLYAHVKKGDRVHVLICAEGVTSRDEARDLNKREMELLKLKRAAEKVSAFLGFSSIHIQPFPDNRMDTLPLLDVVKVIENKIAKVKPEIIYTHSAVDLNIDHQVVHQAVVTACRPVPQAIVKKLLFFEVPSSTNWQMSTEKNFAPTWYVSLSDAELFKKLKALRIYSAEMRPWPHSRSIKAIEALARWRGATMGVEAAEAFELGRCLIS